MLKKLVSSSIRGTELAAFFPDWESLICDCDKSWQWRPLQDILTVYLQMIEDRKVYTSSTPSKFFSWNFETFTKRDVERAVAVFVRLVDAIEQKLPSDSKFTLPSLQTQIDILYPTAVLGEAYIKEDTFLRSFLLALPNRRLSFRYIAPGVQLQSPSDIADQPFPKLFSDLSNRIDYNEKDPIPLLLFRGEGESKSPWVGPWFPDGELEFIPTDLYIEDIAQDYGNQCKLLLPFGIGVNGYARISNGLLLGPSSNPPLLTDEADQLYQIICYSGLLPVWGHWQFLDY
ncbi:hypothetical protein CBS147332_1990 [Penicillium roqueforti]|nr:hypothetical protein CBS147332_1990 [Penicillium roqueforti]KAI3107178.1 hypothetical protein CBS147331_6484 [Penicillium roqueforti]